MISILFRFNRPLLPANEGQRETAQEIVLLVFDQADTRAQRDILDTDRADRQIESDGMRGT